MSMHDINQEIEKIRYELSVTIPEELQNSRYSNDVLECSEYSEILTRQTLLSLRLQQLHKRLYGYSNVDKKLIPKDSVGVGSIVTLSDQQTLQSRIIKLISGEITEYIETNVLYEEVTLNSPIGKVIYNKVLGDSITVKTPVGVRYYKIISLKTIHDDY